ncbi:DNA primase [Gluconobacter wancherniae]|uniref:DNA primase n=1 Tax=Gluconobacter wancherniae TaxID=1307955 RepID=UPI001B8B5D37|nr:DNA primase [Gluconobacter wancherniae]MBS1094320.1 DNA primase [Gluconobacter wancherniae]MBS1094591.1 DNA primase [Gluconobacter wancherniae]
MAFDPAFLDEVRNRTPLSPLIGRRNKLVRSGRNWKTCCPFHGEKSPSFYVYDDHFHCFGCGAHGDAISYVMQSEGRSFPEAVEQLANEAGLDIPKSDPRTEARAREVKSLGDVLNLVQASYRRRLFLPEGREGLAYLRGRGLSDATIERFGLGWSGDGRRLVEELRPHDVTPDMLVQAGLMRVDDRGDAKGELFFNRVTFPIRDRRGRIISFGARTLGDGQPKYLNGPETALFSKRRTLFNLDLAREGVHRGADLVVVEGYMDVIALDQAGFGGAVAPLGTALGEEQLELLWRMSPTPILCLDGDAAGARAALRVCEVSLPLLSPERTLRFCRLDPKDDPDSLIRARGAAAMGEVLKGASSLSQELFGLLTGGETNPTPERRAALRERLVALAKLIPDRSLSSEFRSTFLDMFFERFRKGNGKKQQFKGDRKSLSLSLSHENAGENRRVEAGADERLNILTALLLKHPDILPHVEQAYSHLVLPESLDLLRGALLDWAAQGGELTDESCQAWLEEHGLQDLTEALLAGPLPREVGSKREKDDVLKVEIIESWWHFYGLVNFASFEREVKHDIQEAIMKAYASDAPASDDSGGGAAFPEGLLARMRVLDALRRGEEPEE